MWNTILFDLDGTLTDPKVGITSAVATALAKFDIQEEPDHLTKFIGPPLRDAFMEFYGFSVGQADEAIHVFRTYFAAQGWHENIPYPGVFDLLSTLKSAGKTLIVATSKAEVFALQILEYFKLAPYFSLICGAPINNNAGGKKADIIRNALQRADISDLSGIIMIGDREHDIKGAHEVGIPAVGVLYGYGSREELTACGADYIVPDFSALQALLLSESD